MALDPSRAKVIRQRMAECEKLRRDFWTSKGVELYRAAQSSQIAVYSFETNFRELIGLVSAHFSLKSEGKLGDWNEREPLHQFLFEVTRQLQNFLASATALLEQTECFIKRAYHRTSDICCQYERAVKEQLGSKGIFVFTTKLRDLFLHERTPFIESLIGGSEARGRDRFTLHLNLERVDTTRWEPLAREYITAHLNDLDLELYLLEYHEIIRLFYCWFDERNREWSKPEWDKSLALHDAVIKSHDRIYKFDT